MNKTSTDLGEFLLPPENKGEYTSWFVTQILAFPCYVFYRYEDGEVYFELHGKRGQLVLQEEMVKKDPVLYDKLEQACLQHREEAKENALIEQGDFRLEERG